MLSSALFLSLLVVGALARTPLLKPCHQERDAKLKIIENNPHIVGVTLPTCQVDGNYAAVQCREAVCYCAHESGFTLKGYTFEVGRAWEAACKCAREDYYVQELIGRRVECDEIGNYKSLQCEGSLCYCVDSEEGTQVGDSVRIDEANKLNC